MLLQATFFFSSCSCRGSLKNLEIFLAKCNFTAQGGDGKPYDAALRKAMWVPHVYRISVAQTEYMNEKRQRVTVRSVGPVDWAAESKLLLENIAKLKWARLRTRKDPSLHRCVCQRIGFDPFPAYSVATMQGILHSLLLRSLILNSNISDDLPHAHFRPYSGCSILKMEIEALQWSLKCQQKRHYSEPAIWLLPTLEPRKEKTALVSHLQDEEIL